MDPGTDDALALIIALNSIDIDLIGVTTVGGNARLSHTTGNALSLLTFLGAQDVPVATGASSPLYGSFTYAYHFHGTNGLGLQLPNPSTKTVQTKAADFLVEAVKDVAAPIKIIALGPLTNIAMAMEAEPHLIDSIEEIVVMGGAVDCQGNITEYAEFNIYNDPWAANIVFNSGVPVTLVGLDVTMKVALTDWDLLFTSDGKGQRLARQVLGNWSTMHPGTVYHMHDPLAVLAAIDHSPFSYRTGKVSVITTGEERGRTIALWETGPIRVAMDVDAQFALNTISSLLNSDP
tara:strand:+ start:1529 stop:2401 length:873 start_codon:yes stop_codon:yes gene_type:complete